MPDTSSPRQPAALETRVTLLEDGQKRMEKKIDTISEAVSEGNASMTRELSAIRQGQSAAGKPTWAGMKDFILILIAAGAILWGAFSNSIAAATGPVNQRVTVLEKQADEHTAMGTDITTMKTENKISINERQEHKSLLEKHTASLAEVKETLARINTMTMEQEGQHNSHDLLRNQMMVEEFRLLGLLWQKVYEQPLPESLYFGKVSQERVVK